MPQHPARAHITRITWPLVGLALMLGCQSVPSPPEPELMTEAASKPTPSASAPDVADTPAPPSGPEPGPDPDAPPGVPLTGSKLRFKELRGGCAIALDGQVWCVTEEGAPEWLAVPGLTDAIALGVIPGCAQRSDRTVVCLDPRSGEPRAAHYRNPAHAAGRKKVDHVESACVLIKNTLRCWDSYDGETPGTVGQHTPIQGVVHVSEEWRHRGERVSYVKRGGVLGTMRGGRASGEPHEEKVPGVVEIHLGGFHACALLKDRTVMCRGANSEGQLGQGHKDEVEGWVRVPGLTDVARLWSADTATCAWLADGQLRCFGHLSFEAFPGPDGPRTRSYVWSPTDPDLPGAVDLSEARYNVLCALLKDSRVACTYAWERHNHTPTTPEVFPGWRTLPIAKAR